MLQVIPLRYGTVFKKAFGDREVFSGFASDVLGIRVDVPVVHTEYSYPEAVGRVKVEYDLFGEDPTHAALRQRLDTHGAARLGDVVLDLDADGIAAWVADPNAR